MKTVRRLLAILTCLAVLAAAAVSRQGRLLGYGHGSMPEGVKAFGDSLVVNTRAAGAGIIGYAGPVPLEIVIRHGKVAAVRALPNDETPGFFRRASSILESWNGLSPEEALALEVDAVSGATFSSEAIVANVRAGLSLVATESVEVEGSAFLDTSVKAVAALLVALFSVLLPLFIRKRWLHILQLILNAGVLGFWCGSFLSVSRLTGIMANGLEGSAWPVMAVLLAAAFVFPLFGKKNWYCAHVCPLGSLQQLAGMAPVRKWHMGPSAIRYLTLFRRVLWAVLMILMISGIWADWMDYELFAAFALASAPVAVIAFAVLTLVLSMFVAQPYCRFVCPTGTFFKLCQIKNDK